MKCGIIIQARVGSIRLPSKVLTPMWKDMTMLEVIIHRCREAELPICVATTCNKEDDRIIEIAKEWQCHTFRFQDEADVLGRFINCAKFFGWTHVVRVCADNPLIEPNFIKSMLLFIDKYDYVTYHIDGKNAMYSQTGFFSELVTLESLMKADNALKKMVEDATDLKDVLYAKSFREHVTEYVHQYRIGKIAYLSTDKDLKQIYLSVDFEKDVGLVKEIFEKFGVDVKWTTVLNYLRKKEEHS